MLFETRSDRQWEFQLQSAIRISILQAVGLDSIYLTDYCHIHLDVMMSGQI